LNQKSLNSNEYRMFLTKNAIKIMNLNRLNNTLKNGCGSCTDTMLPERTVVICNKSVCKVILNNKNGLGQGRKYTNSNSLDCPFSYNSAKNNKKNGCSSRNDLFN